MNAVEALYGHLVGDLVRFGVLFMSILTRGLSIREFLAVLADGIARHDALRLSEAGVDGDADLVGGIVGVQRRGVFLAVNRILRLHDILHIAGIIGVGNIVGILLNRDNGRRSVYKSRGSEKGRIGAERKSDNGEDSRKYFQSGSF